jgi:hypothetical protein
MNPNPLICFKLILININLNYIYIIEMIIYKNGKIVIIQKFLKLFGFLKHGSEYIR